jgi:hypothetical protein
MSFSSVCLFDYNPVYLALFKIIATIIDRWIYVLAVDVGDEALIERVCDEWAVLSWRGCDLAVYFPRLISIFFRHRFLGGLPTRKTVTVTKPVSSSGIR